ncbi:poly(A)-specific ribonuclease PNLDC1 isoform X2 [Microcaecilia unicolor]|uniref:Poly(A)-specific ribonuclease PNLDC1 isoform X2 n=1 Tax=Microcaecilia unicolor TaxID=1415580 RepID=A0A6P7WEW3_9AMPH|nr:poly(A)-specific ribonuclease PNLDC1 isoform X2 [Microcaecilia unicolor]
MDIFGSQLEEALPILQEQIQGCDFLAMDMEFTGLHSVLPHSLKPSLFDSADDWYRKVRSSVQKFTVCQIGLSLFFKQKSNRFLSYSYNFFLFPLTFGSIDSEFAIQATSIQFLNEFGFDFNKFLKDGISYLNEEQEERLKKDILTGNWCPQSASEKDKLKEVIVAVTDWEASAKEGDSIRLHNLKGFQMLMAQLVLRQALPDIWTIPVEGSELLVRKVNRQRRQQLENSSLDPCGKNRVLLLARGFTNIFQTIVGAKKPVVGHNMLMDLLHVHHKFYRPLPESYSEFKKNIHTLFPVILDTKILTGAVWKEFQFPWAGNLSKIFDVLSSDMNPASPSCPLIEHAVDCRKYVLIQMAHLLLVSGQGETEELERSYTQYVKIVSKYVNQVNVIRAGFSCVNFSGPDPFPKRPPALLLTVRGWPDVDEQQIYREFLSICRVDVKRLRGTQFLLLTTKFKGVRAIQQEYKGHPNLQLCVYRYWRHSPAVCCVFSVCGVVLVWSAVAFVLGKSVPQHL